MLPSRSRGKQSTTQEDSTPPQRPHTRAFAKLHGLSIKNITLDDLGSVTARSRQSPQILPRRDTREAAKDASNDTRHTRGRTGSALVRADGKTESAVEIRESSSKSKQLLNLQQGNRDKSAPRLSPSQLKTQQQADTRQSESVSAWLDVVSPDISRVSSIPSQILSPGVSSSDFNDMESSSSLNTNKSTTNEEAASTKASTVKYLTFMEHLEFRGIRDTPSHDPKLQNIGLKDSINDTPSHVEFRKLDSLMKVLDHYSKIIRKSIKDQGSDNGFPTYDKLRYEIGRWRPVAEDYRRFPPMPPEDFDWDRGQCSNSSEADFHRTIMISIIDRFDLRSPFAFSCEEQWAVGHHFLIKPTRPKSKISQPKPDLALSFQRNALIDDDLLDYPVELGRCLHPGNRGRERWFPFLFIEAKRDDNSLRDAFEKALYSASQALFNIHQWMRLIPELDEQFFTDVRTFSIVLNNENITLRMHRAERGVGDRLRYRFAEVATIRGYDRFEACHMVKSVLLDYGLPHLHPILRNTYQTVAKIDQRGATGTKRKQDVLDTQPLAQTVSGDTVSEEQNTPEPPSANTGISFDADNLALSASGNTPKRSRRRPRTGHKTAS